MQLLQVAAKKKKYNQNIKWKWKNSSILREIVDIPKQQTELISLQK